METLVKSVASGETTNLHIYLQQALVEANKIITPYWPISTFIASNGLGGLEHKTFAEAIQYGQDWRGAQGFLPLAVYHKFLEQGRITEADLKIAISNTLRDANLPPTLKIGDKSMAIEQLYRNWLHRSETPAQIRQSRAAIWQTVERRLQTGPLFNLSDIAPVKTIGEKTVTKNGQTVTEIINQRMITWCAAFLDEGQAAWDMPGREKGFYQCWKALAGFDNSLKAYTKQPIAKKVGALPEKAEQALIILLQQSGISKEAWAGYLTRHIAQLPGWTSVIQWREDHFELPLQQEQPITLVEYLAVRLFYEVALVEAGQPKPQNSVEKISPASREIIARLVLLAETFKLKPANLEALSTETMDTLVTVAQHFNPQMLWQEAYEQHYRRQLLSDFSAAQSNSGIAEFPKTPAAQAVFCIDVRSEGFRRHLEKRGAYETFGFAGFFGVPMQYRPFGSSVNMIVAPALIKPGQVVREVPKDANPEAIERRLNYNNWKYRRSELFHNLRENLLTPFAFVEIAGWLSFFPLIGKTLLPDKWRQLNKAIEQKLTPVLPTEPSIIANLEEMSIEAQAGGVAGMLKAIGLTKKFARLVFLCGHGSETENNPYASGLDCGACGGNHGRNSAYVAATILNQKAVRAILARQGLEIPEETFFVAGEHNTTTDGIAFVNEAQVPPSHQAEFARFKQDLAEAGTDNALDRAKKLPGAKTSADIVQRAADWAQVRPEWGLVRNAAFICGRRSLTTNLDLDSRVFLHSYDPNQDSDGSILEVIMTAPVVVAEWINMQYYLSAVDNHKFGSDTKLLHTVVSQIGVMQGRQSDLLVGLPKQSVMLGDELFHEPMRLSVIIEAPTARISQIIDKHEKLQHLTQNKWINLLAYDATANLFYQYTRKGDWLRLD